MKILFLTYHGFDPGSGISKKMLAQVKGLREAGHEVHICSYDKDASGHHCRFVDDVVIQDYGQGKWGSLRQRLQMGCVVDYCVREGIELVYARSFMNASPVLIRLFAAFRQHGILSVTEIPTFPYDQEFDSLPIKHKVNLFVDKLFRKQLAAHTDAMVTFSEAEEIFGQRTINISNGVDLDSIPLHQRVDTSKEIHLIAVAEVHPWHGFDRLIAGLGEYYEKMKGLKGEKVIEVFFHVVGDVWDSEMYGTRLAPGFAPIIQKYGIGDKVVFHGKLFGKALDDVFSQCAFAVGSLARHRSGITHLKTLKNREYASRGIPFIYSECDSDFDNQPYVLKAPADESPVDIQCIVDFIRTYDFEPSAIRQTVEHLSWKNQMQQVIEGLKVEELKVEN